MTERMPMLVGCVTAAIGASDLLLVPGLLRGGPRWPWTLVDGATAAALRRAQR